LDRAKAATWGEPALDWKASLVTFSLIFLAELGDKTQLMVMALSAKSRSPSAIFFGAAAALVASALFAVLAGDVLLRHVPLRIVRLITGISFILIGGVFVFRTMR
jgi:putative Ca2+/H+ antiporter (TMEM165/GDT1 family)